MIKEPLSIEQIKQKMELSCNKPASAIIEIFEMQAVDQDFVFVPSDCSKILSKDQSSYGEGYL